MSSPKKKRARKARKPRARKARTYTRYDPETGRKYKVTADDPRYDEWPSRKPSKRSKLATKIRDRPLEYAAERATKVIEARARAATRTAGRKVAGGGLSALAPYAGPLAVAAATIGAAIALWKHQRTYEYRTAGEAINQVSREFAATQKSVMQQLRVNRWDQVPAEQRNQLVNAYKAKIAEISQSIYHAGSLQPSKQIPYGR